MAKSTGVGGDVFAIGQQFWDTWTRFAQDAAKGELPSWTQPLQAFAEVAPGFAGEAGGAVDALGAQGKKFFEFMQSAAQRLGAGELLQTPDLAQLWRKTMADGNPLLDALRSATGEGSRSFEQLLRDVRPLLEQGQQEWLRWNSLPTFGYSREQQQRQQELLRAVADYQNSNHAYQALLLKASQRGMEYFENKLAERSEPGRQIDSARALYDLWVDAAEEAYAEEAMSPEFRKVYAAMVNAQMRLRQKLQKEVEQQCAAFGMPTRSELDGTHDKLHGLQRELRELRRQLAELTQAPRATVAAAVATASEPAARPAAKAAAKAVGKPNKPVRRAPTDQTEVEAEVIASKSAAGKRRKGGK